jgi:hypothetical protein
MNHSAGAIRPERGRWGLGVLLALFGAVAMLAPTVAGAAPPDDRDAGVVVVRTVSADQSGPCLPPALALRGTPLLDADTFALRIDVAAPLCEPVAAAAAVYAMPADGTRWPQALVSRTDVRLAEAGRVDVVFPLTCFPAQFDVVVGATPAVIGPVDAVHGPLLFPFDTSTSYQHPGDGDPYCRAPVTIPGDGTTTTVPGGDDTTTTVVTTTTTTTAPGDDATTTTTTTAPGDDATTTTTTTTPGDDTTTTTPGDDTTTTTTPGDDTTTTVVPDAAVGGVTTTSLADVVVVPAPVAAPVVAGVTGAPGVSPQPAVVRGSQLARTGIHGLVPAAAGALMVASGLTLLVGGRRRR